jgi:hypothetical protein
MNYELEITGFHFHGGIDQKHRFHEGIYVGQWQLQQDLHDASHLNHLSSCVVDPLTKLESVNESSELVKIN